MRLSRTNELRLVIAGCAVSLFGCSTQQMTHGDGGRADTSSLPCSIARAAPMLDGVNLTFTKDAPWRFDSKRPSRPAIYDAFIAGGEVLYLGHDADAEPTTSRHLNIPYGQDYLFFIPHISCRIAVSTKNGRAALVATESFAQGTIRGGPNMSEHDLGPLPR